MIQYISQHQQEIEESGNLYHMKLNPQNRWILLAKHLPWDNLVKIYSEHFSKIGRGTINPRVVIGSLIVKHKLELSNDEAVQTISENPYIQYFLGFREFLSEPPFSSSLFVDWRKRLGNDTFNRFSDVLLQVCFANKIKTDDLEQHNINPTDTTDTTDTTDNSDNKEITPSPELQQLPNKGKLKLDATVADQNITYPNDLGLLNKAREKTEQMIDILFDRLRSEIPVKPRTYRKEARKRYLAEAKKRQKNKASLRKTIRYQLNCLDRNIRHINKMLDLIDKQIDKQIDKHLADERKSHEYPLSYQLMRQFWIIQTLNQQQRLMYNERKNRCDDRIVSISQPHVRPIVRGKQGKNVEFGAKIGLSLADGFAKAQTISWDAYNESADLIPHVLAYKELYGYFPELVQVDKIYGTNANRKWCKENNIRMTVVPKGKPKELSTYEKRKHKKELSERNQIEGKIGQAKQGYGLNQVNAKLASTSNSWIGITLFVTNVIHFAQQQGFFF